MRKIKVFGLLFIASIIFTACGGGGTSAGTGAGAQNVVVNDVRWAATNVETSGNFAATPESIGGRFTFEQAQNACPQGWRLPTIEEVQSLIDVGSEWVTQNDVNGRLFGTGSNSIFFPATTFRATGRNPLTGEMNYVAVSAYYWATPVDARRVVASLFIRSDRAVTNNSATGSFSVRCVQDVE